MNFADMLMILQTKIIDLRNVKIKKIVKNLKDLKIKIYKLLKNKYLI